MSSGVVEVDLQALAHRGYQGATLQQGTRRGMTLPTLPGVACPLCRKSVKEAPDGSLLCTNCRLPVDRCDLIPDGAAEARKEHFVQARSNNGRTPDRQPKYRTLREIAANPVPEPPMQIDGICREGEVGILTGPANRLKSRMGAELAISIASGLPAFGRFTVQRPGKALIVQNEIHTGVFDRRMIARAGPEADWWDRLLVISRQNFRIDSENMLQLDTLMTQEHITFLLLDPMSEMWPGGRVFDENRASDVTEVIDRLKELRDKGRTIIFVHHDPKDRERRARGSGRLIDAPDLRIFLKAVDRQGTETARARVHIESRTMPPPDDFDITLGHEGRLHHEPAGLTDDQEETLDALKGLDRPTTAEFAGALGVETHAALGRLKRLKKRGKVASEGTKPFRWRTL